MYRAIDRVEAFADPACKLQAEFFAVALTAGFNMAGMNAIMLLRAARESGADASFIVMTGEGTEDILTEGLRLGMFALVDKPLNRLALIALVQQAIECHRLRQEVAELRRTLGECGVERGSLMGTLAAESEASFSHRCLVDVSFSGLRQYPTLTLPRFVGPFLLPCQARTW